MTSNEFKEALDDFDQMFKFIEIGCGFNGLHTNDFMGKKSIETIRRALLGMIALMGEPSERMKIVGCRRDDLTKYTADECMEITALNFKYMRDSMLREGGYLDENS